MRKSQGRYSTRLRAKFLRTIKRATQLLLTGRIGKAATRPLFVVGCQRSGTSMMMDIFDRDYRTMVFRETHEKVFQALRLKDLQHVKDVVERSRVPVVVIKPLLDSQRTSDLLEYFPRCVVLWMFRHFKAVAESNLRRFGIRNGIDDLKPIVSNNDTDWRAEKMTDSTRNTIIELFADDMNPHDAAALFWYARNATYFDQGLDNDTQVRLCKYEDLVSQPAKVFEDLYSCLEISFPGTKIVSNVHSNALERGSGVTLSKDVEAVCEPLWRRLSRIYEVQSRDRIRAASVLGTSTSDAGLDKGSVAEMG